MPNTNGPAPILEADEVLVAIAGVALVASVSIFIVVQTISYIKTFVKERYVCLLPIFPCIFLPPCSPVGCHQLSILIPFLDFNIRLSTLSASYGSLSCVATSFPSFPRSDGGIRPSIHFYSICRLVHVFHAFASFQSKSTTDATRRF